jgi:hypothetical protein
MEAGRYVIISDKLGAKTLQKLDQRSKDTAEVVQIEQSYVDFIANLCQNVDGVHLQPGSPNNDMAKRCFVPWFPYVQGGGRTPWRRLRQWHPIQIYSS